jgi:hypothetical protein
MFNASQVLDCAGSHGDMGRAQGEQAGAVVRACFDAFMGGPEMELLRPRWLPRALFRRLARRKARRTLEVLTWEHYPEQAARMQGIADGAGVGVDLLFLGLAAELQLNQVNWVPPGACSALGVRGARWAGEGAAVAKNFDYPAHFRVGFCVRRNTPADGLRSIDVTVAPLAGSHSGVNEAGLAVTYNYGYGQDEGPLAPPITLLVQRLLERCTTVAEAEELARRTPRSGGALLTLADAEGDLAAFEVSPTRFAVRRDPGAVACTNHYLDPHLAEVDVPAEAVHPDTCLPHLRGERVRASSDARLADLTRLLEGEGRFDLAGLEDALRDHGEEDRGTDGTVCRHGPYYETTAAVVLLPAQRMLRAVFGRPCEDSFVEHAVTPEAPRQERRLPLAS